MNWTAFTLVFQGMPMIEPCVRHHIPHFDRYVVVEGPALAMPRWSGSGLKILPEMRSNDGTCEVLERLQAEFPTLRVIHADGNPWLGKTEMCNAALDECLRGGIWQIDSDEFWFPGALATVKGIVESGYSAVEFYARHFWGDRWHHMRIDPTVWGNQIPWRRVFMWDGMNQWLSHEPPRLTGSEGNVLAREGTKALGLYLFHMGYVLEKQLRDREKFYGRPAGEFTRPMLSWRENKTLDAPSGKMSVYRGPWPTDFSFIDEYEKAMATA